MVRWSVAIFAKNEARSIARCLEAVETALAGRSASVTLVVNGSTDQTQEVARSLPSIRGLGASIYTIPFADKSNAWNQYIHRLALPAETYFFIDAYAYVENDAFDILHDALAQSHVANAAAGVPSVGRSAAAQANAMMRDGGLHGSLHALRGGFVDRIRSKHIELPIGLYRGDGLIGSVATHDADCLANKWDKRRIVVCPRATWKMETLSPWRTASVRRHVNRLVNQARGRMENLAIRETIHKGGYESLPQYADRMILDWLRDHPAPRGVFSWLARRKLIKPRYPHLNDLEPTLLP